MPDNGIAKYPAATTATGAYAMEDKLAASGADTDARSCEAM